MSSTSAHANSLPALGVGATEESEAHSLLQPPILVEALLISAALHAVATAVLGVPSGAPALHFVLFAVSDIVLNALAVIPLVAVRRSLLAWHDPLAYLGALFLLSTSTFYFVYLLSPALLHGYVAFFGYNFSGVSQPALLQVFIRAVLVQCSYFAIVLVFNRRPLNQTFVRVGKSEEAYGAALAGVLLVGLGMYSFLRLRATPYFSYVIDNLGRSLAPPTGLARYVLLAGVAASAVSLLLAGWLNVSTPKQRKLSPGTSAAAAALIAVSAVPAVIVGSRIGVITAGFASLATMRHFGYTLSRRVLVVLLCTVLGGGLAVTILRANPGSQPLASRATSPASVAKVSGTRDRIASLALNLDRTANTALVIRQMDTTGHYLKGLSLVAGWDDLVHEYGYRLGLLSSDYRPIWSPQQYMEYWRFGQVTGTSPIPPGAPGQFYMDGGYVGVLLLSAAFAWLLAFFRRRMWASSSLAGRWLYVAVLLAAVNASLSQTSVLAVQLGLTIAAVTVTVLLFRLSVRLTKHS